MKSTCLLVAAWACACAAQAVSADPFFVGWATPMEKVRPRADAQVASAEKLRVRLARGEHEALQIFVRSDRALRNVRVAVSDAKAERGGLAGLFLPSPEFPASCAKVSVLGYVLTSNPPPYEIAWSEPSATNDCGYVRRHGKPELGWWPDPILGHLDRVDVAPGDLQGFWIDFRAPRDQRPGRYVGELAVSADGEPTRRIQLEIRVNGFEVPAKTPLPTAITFHPGPSEQFATAEEKVLNQTIKDDPASPVNIWKKHEREWVEMLADHYVTIDNLYHQNETYPKCEALAHLAAEGRLDCFNLGYWHMPKSLSAADKEAWRGTTLALLRKNWERAKAAGIAERAYVYGCDEIPADKFDLVSWALAEIRKALPGVPVSTTAYDDNFGVGTVLSEMDWFTPLTPKFDPAKAALARREGRQVWWYICCGPKQPYANMFIECPAIEGRILMGAQTVKYRPDGFLYYQITLWNALRPISGPSAFTDWPARIWTKFHGDGSWTCCGPDGAPLSTVRLENFRDGLEDYAYARALERRLLAHPDAPWADEARRLLAVPDAVARNLVEFTNDPQALYAWRDRMADLIDDPRTEPEGRERAQIAAVRTVCDLELVPPEIDENPAPATFGFPKLDFAMNGGMALAPGGRLWATWVAGGDSERAFTVGSWSDDGGKTWNGTRFRVGSPDPVCHVGKTPVHVSLLIPNLWSAPDGTLRLYLYQGVNMFDQRGALFEAVCRNPDASEPKWDKPKFLGWGSAHNKPIVLRDGTWLLPNDFEDQAWLRTNAFPELNVLRGCGVLASTDGGRVWERRGVARPADERHFAEHAFVERPDGSLHMLMRTGRGLMESTSEDAGRTWTEPRPTSAIRQPVARFGYLRLASGRLLLVKNGSTPRRIAGNAGGLGARAELTAFVSDDEGATWTGGLPIDPRARVAYPDAFQAPDGWIYVSYDHDRTTKRDEILFARFREEDVRAGRPVTPGASFTNVVFSAAAR